MAVPEDCWTWLPWKQKLFFVKTSSSSFKIDWLLGVCAPGLCELRNLATALIPSWCGILVYKELTSKVTSQEFGGTELYGMILLMKSVVSLKYDGVCGTMELIKKSTNCEILSVGQLLAETISLPGGVFCRCGFLVVGRIMVFWDFLCRDIHCIFQRFLL